MNRDAKRRLSDWTHNELGEHVRDLIRSPPDGFVDDDLSLMAVPGEGAVCISVLSPPSDGNYPKERFDAVWWANPDDLDIEGMSNQELIEAGTWVENYEEALTG